jgi:hypothetical protein
VILDISEKLFIPISSPFSVIISLNSSVEMLKSTSVANDKSRPAIHTGRRGRAAASLTML